MSVFSFLAFFLSWYKLERKKAYMFKKILPVLALSVMISGCNYFTDAEVTASPETFIVEEPTKVGNAQEIITNAAKKRGFETKWQAQGFYHLTEAQLQASNTYSFGEILVKFQELFTRNNIALEETISLKNPSAKLHHSPYVLIFVCGKDLYVKEIPSNDYAYYNRALKNGLVKGCTTPEKAFISKAEQEKRDIANNVPPPSIINTPNNVVSSEPSSNFNYEAVDLQGEHDKDINSIDFGNIIPSKELIETLEKETGEKFDMEKYKSNLNKKYGN